MREKTLASQNGASKGMLLGLAKLEGQLSAGTMLAKNFGLVLLPFLLFLLPPTDTQLTECCLNHLACSFHQQIHEAHRFIVVLKTSHKLNCNVHQTGYHYIQGFLTFLAPLELSVAVPGSVALLTAALLLQLAAAPHLPAYQQAILSCIAQAPGSKCQCSYEQDPSY